MTKKGYKQTEEHRHKSAVARTGLKRRPHTEETKRKISAARVGKRATEDARRAMSIAQRKRLPFGQSSFNRLYGTQKGKARERNLSWKLSEEQFRVLVNGNCYYCGTEPAMIRKGAGNGDFIYNGIDRINSYAGYTEDNVVSCCKKCNLAKHVMSIEEFDEWIIRVYNHREVRSEC